MSDISDRLRSRAAAYYKLHPGTAELLDEAATKIERLRAEVERLQADVRWFRQEIRSCVTFLDELVDTSSLTPNRRQAVESAAQNLRDALVPNASSPTPSAHGDPGPPPVEPRIDR